MENRGPEHTDPSMGRVAALARIAQGLARPLDAEEMFQVVFSEAARVLDATIVILGFYDEANQIVHVVKQVYGGVETPGGSFPLGSGFTSEAIRTRQPRLIRRWSVEGPPITVRYASGEGKPPESGLTVPIVWGERVLGVLLIQSYDPEAYGEEDLVFAQAVAGQLAAALGHLGRSEHLDAQLERRVSELEAILASMADALLILDAEGRIVRVNPAARALLSGGQSRIVLGAPLDGAHWDRWPAGPRAVAQALAPAVAALRRGEALGDVEVELGGDGHRVLGYSCAPIRQPGGALAGGVVVFRDLTGRREVE